jgi:hypothetical protein
MLDSPTLHACALRKTLVPLRVCFVCFGVRALPGPTPDLANLR